MQNLKYPSEKILINSISRDDVGVYLDTEANRRVLAFKKLGIEIPGASTTTALTGVYANNAALQAALPLTPSCCENIKIAKECFYPGEYAGQCVTLNATCGCDECDYEYGITVVKRVKEPGVNNSDFNPFERYYGSKLDKINCTGGLIDDSDLLTMEDEIIDQITNDLGRYNNNDFPNSNFQSIVDAYKTWVVEVTDFANAASTVIITLQDGTSFTVALSTATGLYAPAADINTDANVNTYIHATTTYTATPLVYVTIRGIDPGYIFSVTAGVGTVVIAHKICLKSKSLDNQFDIKIDSKFGTICNWMEWYFDNTTVTAPNTGSMYIVVNGVTSAAIATDSNETTFQTNLIAAITTLGWLGDIVVSVPTANHILITADCSVITSFSYYFAGTNPLQFPVTEYAINGKGKWARLTSEDVFRIFAYNKHAGNFAAEQWAEQPIKDAYYCHYHLTSYHSGYPGLHGANHMVGYKQELDIYVLSSLVDDVLYDGNDPATAKFLYATSGATPDIPFETLLEVWRGALVIDW